ncbi:hypothetical protein [Priestia abyssalis]|uniref:hypothetical protein n=1 Tax=Priestia abyssalis TaxID=1221450 RepID=UPI00099567E6|nr:hypothetical protein [Priestia abyssalis]
MKKRTLSLVLVPILIALVGLGYYLNEKFNTTYGVWDINWGFEVPKPSKMTNVIESDPSFRGEGESYIIADYSENKVERVKNQTFWKEIDGSTLEEVSKQISQFQKDVKDINFEKEE